jgi:hypothetical protein
LRWWEMVGWLLPRGPTTSHTHLAGGCGGQQRHQPQAHRVSQRGHPPGQLGRVALGEGDVDRHPAADVSSGGGRVDHVRATAIRAHHVRCRHGHHLHVGQPFGRPRSSLPVVAARPLRRHGHGPTCVLNSSGRSGTARLTGHIGDRQCIDCQQYIDLDQCKCPPSRGPVHPHWNFPRSTRIARRSCR